MADDWIKMRKELEEDPAVLAICNHTGLNQFYIVGALHRIWSWADSHCDQRGNVDGVTLSDIDRMVNVKDFGLLLTSEKICWLARTETGLRFPKFSRHMSQSAKRRALNARRMRAKRNAQKTHNLRTRGEQKRVKKRKRKESGEATPSRGESGGRSPGRDGPDPQVLADLRQLQDYEAQGLSRGEALAKLDANGKPEKSSEIV